MVDIKKNQKVDIQQNGESIIVTSLQVGSTPGIYLLIPVKTFTNYVITLNIQKACSGDVVLYATDNGNKRNEILPITMLKDGLTNKLINSGLARMLKVHILMSNCAMLDKFIINELKFDLDANFKNGNVFDMPTKKEEPIMEEPFSDLDLDFEQKVMLPEEPHDLIPEIADFEPKKKDFTLMPTKNSILLIGKYSIMMYKLIHVLKGYSIDILSNEKIDNPKIRKQHQFATFNAKLLEKYMHVISIDFNDIMLNQNTILVLNEIPEMTEKQKVILKKLDHIYCTSELMLNYIRDNWDEQFKAKVLKPLPIITPINRAFEKLNKVDKKLHLVTLQTDIEDIVRTVCKDKRIIMHIVPVIPRCDREIVDSYPDNCIVHDAVQYEYLNGYLRQFDAGLVYTSENEYSDALIEPEIYDIINANIPVFVNPSFAHSLLENNHIKIADITGIHSQYRSCKDKVHIEEMDSFESSALDLVNAS